LRLQMPQLIIIAAITAKCKRQKRFVPETKNQLLPCAVCSSAARTAAGMEAEAAI